MKISRCSSCQAEIVWLKTNMDKWLPMDADFMGRIGDIDDAAPPFDWAMHGDGVHWRTCPNAERHRRGR